MQSNRSFPAVALCYNRNRREFGGMHSIQGFERALGPERSRTEDSMYKEEKNVWNYSFRQNGVGDWLLNLLGFLVSYALREAEISKILAVMNAEFQPLWMVLLRVDVFVLWLGRTINI